MNSIYLYFINLSRAKEVASISVAYLLSAIIYYKQNIVAGVLLIICGVMVFVLNAYRNKTLVDLYSLFLTSWLITLGLSMLQLLNYQRQWSIQFFIITYLGLIAMVLGLSIGKKNSQKSLAIKSDFKRSYYTVAFTGIISVFMFTLSYLNTGIIPLFSDKLTSYHDHYTRFYVILVGMLPSVGLAYYVLKTFSLKNHQKFLLWLTIIVHLLIIPLIYVSRGNFVIGVLFVLPVFYYYSNNKKRLLSLGVILFVALLIAITSSRNYSNEDVEFYFQPKTVTIFNTRYRLTNNWTMIYGYLTISHDNFNHNLMTLSNYSYGGRLIQPFEVIIRTKYFSKLRDNNELQNISYGLNTHNMMGIIYYDFGVFGLILLMFIYGTTFGIIEKNFRINMNPFNAMIYGGAIIVVALGFFTAWTTQFTLWMWWGTTFILWLFQFRPQSNSLNKFKKKEDLT